MTSCSSRDRIILKDLSLFAKHGPFDAEAELGNVLPRCRDQCRPRLCRARGRGRWNVNWAKLADVTTEAFMARRYKLVEAAAAAVASAVLGHFDRADRVRVEVRKPSAPIEAIFAFTSIVVERDRRR